MQPKPAVAPAFVPVPIRTPKAKPDIVIEIQRGAAKVRVRWPRHDGMTGASISGLHT